MKTTLLLLAAIPAATALVLQSPSAQLKAHADKLLAAPSFSATYTVQPIGGAPEEQSLQLAKPNLARWESPSKLVVTDGKTLWTYDKAGKTYTEQPATASSATEAIPSLAWQWSAFFDSRFAEQIGASKPGRARKFRGASIKEVDLTFAKRANASCTLYVDDQTGVVRGGMWKVQDARVATETIVFADKLEVGANLPDSTFTFAAPAGAKKLEGPAAGSTAFRDVSPIFMGNCVGCHGTRQRSGGLNLGSYESVMAGSRNGKVVVAGDPASSPVMLHLRGNGRAVMPPRGKMPDEIIAKIEKWISDGALP